MVQSVIVILQVALGLGLVIFIHELGHFLAAKWAGVKVERFSVGFPFPDFGPIAILAGTLGALMFSVFRSAPTGALETIWWTIGGTIVGTLAMFLGKWGSVRFFSDRDGTEYVLGFLPLGGYVKMLGQDDSDPSTLSNEELRQDPRSYTAQPVYKRMVIISAGVIMNVILAFVMFVFAFRSGVEYSPCVIQHVYAGSAAWNAGLLPGDEIVQIDDRKMPKFVDLQTAAALSPPGESIRLMVQRSGQSDPFPVVVNAVRNQDELIARIGVTPTSTTRLQKANMIVDGMPAQKADPAFEGGDVIVAVNHQRIESFPELQLILARYADEEVTITVDRMVDSGETLEIDILVPAAPVRSYGVHMTMGPVLGIQPDSVAEKSGLQKGDQITHIDGKSIGNQVAPVNLPSLFFQQSGSQVELELLREGRPLSVTLIPEERPGWGGLPTGPDQPVAIPSIGIIYHVLPEVTFVDPESDAASKGLKKGDRLSAFRLLNQPQMELQDISGKTKGAWGYIATRILQRHADNIEFVFQEKGTVQLESSLDKNRFLPIRGMLMEPLLRDLQTDNVVEAFQWGARETWDKLVQVYLTVRGMVVGQISVKAVSGPVGIIRAAGHGASRGFGEFLTLLGMISANLAVINFFPIPVLDGGHMVFLIWELFLGKPPSEKVLVVANYLGLLLIAGLMVGVLYLDLFVHKLIEM